MVVFSVAFQQFAVCVRSIRCAFAPFTAPGRLLLCAAMLAGLLGLMPLRVAHAGANIVVNTLSDFDSSFDGACSLREAIIATNMNADHNECHGSSYGSDTISFNVSGVISLTTSLPAINDVLMIDGAFQNITISGDNIVRVMYVNAGRTLTLQYITVADGNGGGPGCGIITCGGGIFNLGTLIVASSTFSHNSAAYGGGVYNNGIVTVNDSTFSGNSSIFSGGGIYNFGTVNLTGDIFTTNNSVGNGGGIINFGTVSMAVSTFSSNTADVGGAFYNNTGGKLDISISTLSNNSTSSAASGGGGIYNAGLTSISDTTISGHVGSSSKYGGGIYNDSAGALTIVGSTISNNTALSTGGGVMNSGAVTSTNSTYSANNGGLYGGAIYNQGTATVNNNTFASNSAVKSGGGIYNANTLRVVNSLFAYSGLGFGGDCVNIGTVTGSHNLIQEAATACGLINGTNGNIIGVDPLLGTFAYHGGNTWTYALLPGTPAVNAGDNATCATTDQRDVIRPQAGTCDIGAFEYVFPHGVSLPMTLR